MISVLVAVRGLMSRDRGEVGVEPRDQVNILQNQAEIILSVVDERALSCQMKMTFASENRGRNLVAFWRSRFGPGRAG